MVGFHSQVVESAWIRQNRYIRIRAYQIFYRLVLLVLSPSRQDRDYRTVKCWCLPARFATI